MKQTKIKLKKNKQHANLLQLKSFIFLTARLCPPPRGTWTGRASGMAATRLRSTESCGTCDPAPPLYGEGNGRGQWLPPLVNFIRLSLLSSSPFLLGSTQDRLPTRGFLSMK